MAVYKRKCSDGSDPKCTDVAILEIEEEGLTDAQVTAYIEEHEIDAPVCPQCGRDG